MLRSAGVVDADKVSVVHHEYSCPVGEGVGEPEDSR